MKSKYSFIILTIFLLFPGILHAQQTLTVNTTAAVNINNGQRVQMNFTAPSAGTYRFESSHNGSFDPTAFSAASGTGNINDDGGQGSNFLFTHNLRAGEILTFFAGVHSNRGSGSYTVGVSVIPSVSITANAPVSVNINNGQRVQLSFTAPYAGEFRFESTNNGTLDPVAFSAASGTGNINDDSGEGKNFRFSRILSAGELFTFFAGIYNDNGNGGYTVNVQGSQIATAQSAGATVSLTVNAATPVTIYSGGRTELSFTAPTDGNYAFFSSNNGTLDPEAFSAAGGTGTIDDNSGEGRNFYFTRVLREGEVFTFFAGVYGSGARGNYSVNVQGSQSVAETQTPAATSPTTAAPATPFTLTQAPTPAPASGATAAALNPRTGNITGLTVLVQFPDQRMSMSVTREMINDWLNTGSSSVRGYFLDVSNGRLDYTNILTPVITMDHPKSHYDVKVNYATGSRAHVDMFLAEIMDKLTRTNVDLSSVTKDANGRVLALNIIYIGTASHEWREGLWPHAGSLNANVTIRGAVFRNYQLTDWGPPFIIPSIRTFVHENGHMLMGWPDIYAPPARTEPSYGIGIWCVMANGIYPNAAFRHRSGWIDVTDITNARDGTRFTLTPNSHTALMYRRNEKEAFYIEALTSEGRRYGIPPGTGLAIWHIHTDGDNWRLASRGFPYVALLQADGRDDLGGGNNRGDTTDLFRPGVNTHFNSMTVPAAVWHDGLPSGLRITGIENTGNAMTFIIGDIPRTSANDFLLQVLSFANAQSNMVIELREDITLTETVNIPVPRNPNATLTIRSANPARPATIKRGAAVEMLRVSYGSSETPGVFIPGATLILENIILDGDSVNFPDNTTPLVLVDGVSIAWRHEITRAIIGWTKKGSNLIMNSGAVLRNNIGGGVEVQENSFFTMNGGEISGNTANTADVTYIDSGTFAGTMTLLSETNGGGVRLRIGFDAFGTFTMNGGRIVNNTGGNIRNNSSASALNINGGLVAGPTSKHNPLQTVLGNVVPIISGDYNINKGTAPNNAVTVMWNRPNINAAYYGGGVYNYTEGSTADLIMSVGSFASWSRQGDKSGISYRNGANTGFVEMPNAFVSSNEDLVTTMAVFQRRIADHANVRGDIVINIGQNMTIDTRLTIPKAVAAGGRLIIRGAGRGAPIVLTRGINGNLFTVSDGAILVLENIIIDGNSAAFPATGGVLMRVERGGFFTMNSGAVIRNNSNTSTQGSGLMILGSFNMTGGEISGNTTNPRNVSSGGVSIERNGAFTMSGGLITRNTGGVSADRDSSFTISGGAISGNMEHGVNSHNTTASQAVLSMTGGEISNNAKSGVRGTLTMSGGLISGNRDSGVSGSLVMSGGEISGNTAESSGGGVYATGSFTMTGGLISGNTAGRSGGGVNIGSSLRRGVEFIMQGGEISGNTAPLGAGVSVHSTAIFTLRTGRITANNASQGAGGVLLDGTLNMQGGEINANTAGTYAGGVDVNGVFNMQGGVIRGNIVGDRFNNVNVSVLGRFNRTGGEIIDRSEQ
ncbi:MAG: M6 family metalloprotease domain-containing protein [Treponema sp.]|jgi:M6 family metalloprotease-like protein|nr:M6 family metalloprotease domain-containing protein [Treponema sp.]